MARKSLLQWKAPRLYKQSLSGATAFTTNIAVDDTVLTTSGSHNLTVGDLVEFQEPPGESLQPPLSEDIVYQVFEAVSATNFSVTLDGINEIVLTNNGTNASTYKSYSTNVILENFIVTEDAPENRVFWHESIINNHREVVNEDKMHWALGFKLNLFKEGTLSVRRTDFDELFGYLYTDVYVSRYNDNALASILIRDSDGDPVSFVMDRFNPSFLTQSDFEDVLDIGLKSKDVIDLSETL